MDVKDAKKKCRAEAMARRDALYKEIGTPAGERLAENVLATGLIHPGDVVSGFWPMGAEIDLVPLLTKLSGIGCTCVLPVVRKKDTPLIFLEWRPETVMRDAAFGTKEPPADAPERIPNVVLAPLLAFDKEGYRIGYGGGYYDRSLAALRAAGSVIVIGVAYAGQEMDAVPHDGFDQPLDWVVTEEGARKFGRITVRV